MAHPNPLQDHINNIYASLGVDPNDMAPPSGGSPWARDPLGWHLANITALHASGGGGSGGGGTALHNLLINRDVANQHPISAITNLQTELNRIITNHNQLGNRNIADQHDIAAITGLQASLTGLLNAVNGKADLSALTAHTSNTDVHTSSSEKAVWNGKYNKPSTGIPKEDMSQAVQESLDKAGTALQSFTETDPTVPGWAKQPQKPTYTPGEVGAIPASEKGTANGVATLGNDGKVPASQLPPSSQQGIGEAPTDGKTYGRKDEAWVEIEDSEGGGYTPPAGGIPKTDLSPEVQGLLENAETALQEEEDPVYSADKPNIALKSDVNAAVSGHNTSTDAHTDIRDILNDLSGLPEWDSDNYTMTFTARNGQILTINLPLEALTKDVDYDTVTKEVILTKWDDTEIRINVADLVDEYTGLLTAHIQVIIENHEIKAVLLAGTIGENELSPALLAKINGKAEQADVEAGVETSKTYTDGQCASLGQSLTNEITTAAGNALQEAKNYTDDQLDDYVLKEAGKSLTDNNYTTPEKEKLASLESPKFKGTFTSVNALIAAYPTAQEGDSADVIFESGIGYIEFHRFLWDITLSTPAWADKGTAGADSAASIKNKYESNADTNAFTDIHKSKLDAFIQSGKQLSTEDYTTSDRTKLSGLQNYDDSSVQTRLGNVESGLVYKVDTVAGKQLSSNDYTTLEKAKLSTLENYDDSEIKTSLALKANQASVYTKSETYNKQEIDAKVDSIFRYRGTVNDMTELLIISGGGQAEVGDVYRNLDDSTNYAWDGDQWSNMGGDFDMSGYITQEIASQEFVHQDTLDNLLDNKVDKQNGYGLSQNDFTSADKEKLDELENYQLPSDVVRDSSYVKTDNNYTTADKTIVADVTNKQNKLTAGTSGFLMTAPTALGANPGYINPNAFQAAGVVNDAVQNAVNTWSSNKIASYLSTTHGPILRVARGRQNTGTWKIFERSYTQGSNAYDVGIIIQLTGASNTGGIITYFGGTLDSRNNNNSVLYNGHHKTFYPESSRIPKYTVVRLQDNNTIIESIYITTVTQWSDFYVQEIGQSRTLIYIEEPIPVDDPNGRRLLGKQEYVVANL